MSDNIDSKSFVLGAASVATLVGINHLRKLFTAPSPEYIQKVATQPMKHMGDDDKVTVWGFELKGEHSSYHHGVSDPALYTSRVEAYLRLIGQPYVKAASQGTSENPRGKVPFANVKGYMVDDSNRIIETIKNTFDVKVDESLTPEQRATGHLLQQTLQGSLYFVILHQAFDVPEGRRMITREFSKKLPPIVSTLVIKMVFRNMYANLYGSGIGRMPHADIVRKGQEDLRAINTILGNQKYILGTDRATSYDSDLYTWLVSLFYDEVQVAQPWVGEIKKELPNLVEYVDRMRALLYPELQK